jgi:hypothetical protein
MKIYELSKDEKSITKTYDFIVDDIKFRKITNFTIFSKPTLIPTDFFTILKNSFLAVYF